MHATISPLAAVCEDCARVTISISVQRIKRSARENFTLMLGQRFATDGAIRARKGGRAVVLSEILGLASLKLFPNNRYVIPSRPRPECPAAHEADFKTKTHRENERAKTAVENRARANLKKKSNASNLLAFWAVPLALGLFALSSKELTPSLRIRHRLTVR